MMTTTLVWAKGGTKHLAQCMYATMEVTLHQRQCYPALTVTYMAMLVLIVDTLLSCRKQKPDINNSAMATVCAYLHNKCSVCASLLVGPLLTLR